MSDSDELAVKMPVEAKICKEKAGMVMIGERASVSHEGAQEMCIVAPWLEGAFDDAGTKAYMLPRGSVDNDEIEQALAQALPYPHPVKDTGYLGAAGFAEIIKAMHLDVEEIKEAREAELHKKPHESMRDLMRVKRFLGALRETYEETGINITRIKGFPSANVHSQGYLRNGVEIASAITHDKPLDMQLMQSDEIVASSRTNPHRQTLYMVNIDGIERLMSNAKGSLRYYEPQEEALPDTFGARVSAKENAALPDFEQMMDVLRTGMVPFEIEDIHQADWLTNKEIKKKAIFAPSFVPVEREWIIRQASQSVSQTVVEKGVDSPEAQAALARLGEIAKAENLQMDETEFDAFYNEELALDKTGTSQGYANRLKEDTATIKCYLKNQASLAEEMGDATGLKLNVKNRPLRWTREGADLITIDEYAHRVSDFAQSNDSYRKMMGEFVINDRENGYEDKHKSTLQILKELCTSAFRQSEFCKEKCSDELGVPDRNIRPLGATALGRVQREIDDPQGALSLRGIG